MPLNLSRLILLAVMFVLFPNNSLPNRSQQPSAGLPPTMGIRSTTKLVQLSVVVQDKHGVPIHGLLRDQFTVLDDGRPQELAFFSEGTPPSTVASPLSPDVFTNRLNLKQEDTNPVTVVLFDALNTTASDQGFVRNQVLEFLRVLKPSDRVAVYALTTKLIVLHELTEDSSALVASVRKFQSSGSVALDASNPNSMNILDMTENPQDWSSLRQAIEAGNGVISAQATVDRINETTSALTAIADHLVSIPGRPACERETNNFNS